MARPAKTLNKHVNLTKRKGRFIGFKEGVEFTIHYRVYRDKRGKVRRVIAGPGLREA